MGIRMSGLSSGMDTEAVVGALMSAQSLKKTKIEQAKTKLEWKKTMWSDLNKKMVGFYNKWGTKMQLPSTFLGKTASVSDSTKAKVSASSSAVNGSYTMEISNIATAEYVTGAKINSTSTKDKLVDIDNSLLNKEIAITNGGTTSKFTIDENTTIDDFVNELKNAGLNASYDTNQQRFFISGKDTGAKNVFSITSSALSQSEIDSKQALKDAVGYDSMSTSNKSIVNETIKTLQSIDDTSSDEYSNALNALAKASYDTKNEAATKEATSYAKAEKYNELYASKEAAARESLKSQYYEEDGVTLLNGKTEEDFNNAVAKKADEDTLLAVNEYISSDEGKADIAVATSTGITSGMIAGLGESSKGFEKFKPQAVDGMEGITEDTIKADISETVSNYVSVGDRNLSTGESALSKLGLGDITLDEKGKAVAGNGSNTGMTILSASDSVIKLNGAELTSSTTTVSANGLDISLSGLTAKNSPITFAVSNDVDGIYNMVKDFLTEYNDLMKEMYGDYNADDASEYSVLTSEQKEAMSDDEVEKWETKIKDSLLRRDQNLGSVMDAMKSALQMTTTVNGKQYSLSSFGIMTSTDYKEGGLLHIFGDSDDSVYSGKEDKLKKALTENSDDTSQALANIFSNLRSKMFEKMKASSTSSALTFYNDKSMDSDIDKYDKQIETWKDKLAAMEDSYYAKFTKMESAMAKLNASTSSITSLLGSL